MQWLWTTGVHPDDYYGGQQTREMLVLDTHLTNKNPLVWAAPRVKWSYELARAEAN